MKRPFLTVLVASIILVTLSRLNVSAQVAGSESRIPSGYSGRPVAGVPVAIPGVIQAEAYDTTPENQKDVTVGGPVVLHQTAFRSAADSVGLARYGSGHVSTTGEAEAADQVYVGWTVSGEWLAYTVRVAETGTYAVGGKFAAGGKGSIISLSFTPELSTGAMEIPTTAGYQPQVEVYHVWEVLDDLKQISLPAGDYVMKLKIEKAAGLNLDYLTLKKTR